MRRWQYVLLFLGLVGAWLVSCSRGQKDEVAEQKKQIEKEKKIIVVRVGDRKISAREFRYIYEFSPGPFRLNPAPRDTILAYLIKERTLALEGYRQGFNKSPYVQRRMKHRRYTDLLEAFYKKHVHGRVHIPEDKLEDAIKKSTVKYRLRLWPTRTRKEAEKALAEARQIGFPEFIRRELQKNEVPGLDEKRFETDWLDFLDIKPQIFRAIKDLEIGKLSDPIPYGKGYAIMQVIDLQREGIREDELKWGPRRKRMEDRLHDIQADSIVHALMDSLLTPLDIRVKGRVVEELIPPLRSWLLHGLPHNVSLVDYVLHPDSSTGYLDSLRALMNETLVTYKGGKKTVRDYIDYMDYWRTTVKSTVRADPETFRNALITEIGRMMKNNMFVSIAEKEGFLDSAEVAEDLRFWEEKWTYEAYRFHVVDNIEISEEEMREWFKHHWRELPVADVDSTRFESYRSEVYNEILHKKQVAILNRELRKLKSRYPVWINWAYLRKMQFTDDQGGRGISVFVRKRFTGKEDFPTLDLNWLYVN